MMMTTATMTAITSMTVRSRFTHELRVSKRLNRLSSVWSFFSRPMSEVVEIRSSARQSVFNSLSLDCTRQRQSALIDTNSCATFVASCIKMQSTSSVYYLWCSVINGSFIDIHPMKTDQVALFGLLKRDYMIIEHNRTRIFNVKTWINEKSQMRVKNWVRFSERCRRILISDGEEIWHVYWTMKSDWGTNYDHHPPISDHYVRKSDDEKHRKENCVFISLTLFDKVTRIKV